MTFTQIFVSFRQSIDVRQRGNCVKFPPTAAIAGLTCENQVPYAIQIPKDALSLKDVGKEVVYIGEILISRRSRNRREAIKAVAFLVTVQCIPGACDGDSGLLISKSARVAVEEN